MNELMPCDSLEAVLSRFIPKEAIGRKALYPLSTMFRIHCNATLVHIRIQRWEGALCYLRFSHALIFTDLPLDIPITYLDSDHEFSNLLEKHKIFAQLFKEVE